MATSQREKDVRELLELRRLYEPHKPRDKELCARLLAEGESFKIVFDGLGKASISAPQPARVTGTAPEVVVEKFLALPKAEQNTLIKRGIVRIAEQKKDAYSGRVTVELF
jgi:hypothetical protein